MAEEQQHVAIVGGGLALILEGNHKGMALALALANHGTLIPTIYELRDEEDNRGANIALAPNGLRVLHHIGVYDRIRTKGFNFETVTTYNAQGQNLGSFLNGSERHYNFSALRIHRSLVLKGLLDEVKAQGILIHNNMKLLSIEEETDSGAKLKFENGQTVEADFVIGADGIYSKVRPYITDVELVYSGSIGIIGLSVPKDQLHETHKSISFPAFTFGKSGFVAMLPSNYDGSVVDFFSTFPFPSQDREYWDDFMKRKDKQQKMLIERFGGGDWPAHITRVVKEQARENLNGHPFFEVPELEHWYSPKGHVILLGDAAHAMSPLAGIGASVAFEDAESLMYTMTHKDFKTRRLDLLSMWETHRKERIKKVLKAARENGKKRRPESNSFKQVIKELIMWGQAMWNGPTGGLEWMYGYKVEDEFNLPAV